MRRPPVTIPGTWELPLEGGTEARYRVWVAAPSSPAPEAGYPVVYVLDAERIFGTVVEAIRMRAARPDATGVGPAIVVGIASTQDGAVRRAGRLHDYTPWSPADPDTVPTGTETGGAPAFLAFLSDVVAPAVEAELPVDAAHQALIGHSLAGLFTLWALVSGARFTAYVAASPSVWWNRQALDMAIARSAPVPDARLLITAGEYERQRAPWQPDGAQTDDAIRRRVERRMVDHAREVASALSIRGADRARVVFHEFPGEDHASVVILTIARALRFVLPPACLLDTGVDSRVERTEAL